VVWIQVTFAISARLSHSLMLASRKAKSLRQENLLILELRLPSNPASGQVVDVNIINIPQDFGNLNDKFLKCTHT